MKILPKLRMTARKGLVLTAVVAAFVGVSIVYNTAVQADVTFPATTADCNRQAVIRCGVTSVTSIKTHYAADSSVRNIYSGFGISSSDISTMGTYAVAGYVTDTNKVYVNGNSTAVATNAMTAGRFDSAGSTRFVTNGTVYYKRAPSVSFPGKSMPAFVVIKDGVFQYAIYATCGNPVQATPKKPNYTIAKYVAAPGKTYSKDIPAVAPNTKVSYEVNVTGTGEVAAVNVVAKDVLPANVTYVSGTLTQNGIHADASKFFSTGIVIAKLAPGQVVQYKFAAIVGATDTPEKCTNLTLTNTATIMSTGLPTKSDTATVKEVCAPKPVPPVYTCDKLTPTQVSRNEFSFTTKATATNGATITSYVYNFGDNTAPVTGTSTANHTYANPGTYTTTATVNFTVNGVAKTATSPACQTKVTVSPQPFAQCTNVTATIGENRAVTVNATYTAQNGATLNTVSFDFGDNTAPVTGTSTTASHTYAADGSFTIKATMTFNGATATPNENCQAVVSFNTPQPVYTCDKFDITQGDNRTVTVSDFQNTATNGAVFKSVDVNWGDNTSENGIATIVGKTHQYGQDGTYVITALAHFTMNGQDVTAGGAHCTQTVTFTTPTPPVTPPTPTPPAVLVNTGAGSVAGLFGLATIGGTFAYRWFLGRRLNQN